MNYVNITIGVLCLGLLLSLFDRYYLERKLNMCIGFIGDLSVEQAESTIGVQAVFESLPEKQRKKALENFDRIKVAALKEIEEERAKSRQTS